jgi:undecaprenyl-diphosphatase
MPGPPEAHLRIRDALALGLLHGPAELLPISSSAHVVLVPWLLDWPYAELDDDLRKAFEVALHAGTVAALLIGLRGEVGDALRALDARGVRLLALSTLPAAGVGLAFERVIARRMGSPAIVASGLAAGGVALAVADARSPGARGREDAGALDALWLGIAQACALAPGVSRSGAALTAARVRGFARPDAGVLSRHAALPVIGGATALQTLRLARRGGLPAGMRGGFAAGVAGSFGATLATIRLVRALERDRSMLPFAAYRVALAATVAWRLRGERRMARAAPAEAQRRNPDGKERSRPRAAAQ